MISNFNRWIFCQKKLFLPRPAKKLWKNFPIFLTFRSGNLSKIALFWEKKLSRLANLGVNIENRVKSIKIALFWVKITLPHSYFFSPISPPLLFFGRIFSYANFLFYHTCINQQDIRINVQDFLKYNTTRRGYFWSI